MVFADSTELQNKCNKTRQAANRCMQDVCKFREPGKHQHCSANVGFIFSMAIFMLNCSKSLTCYVDLTSL